jgi:hypothetical protein
MLLLSGSRGERTLIDLAEDFIASAKAVPVQSEGFGTANRPRGVRFDGADLSQLRE